MSCPHCKSTAPAGPAGFYLPTWIFFGGKLGNKLFGLGRCPQCKKVYDARNGTDPSARIAVASTILVIVLAITLRYAIQH